VAFIAWSLAAGARALLPSWIAARTGLCLLPTRGTTATNCFQHILFLCCIQLLARVEHQKESSKQHTSSAKSHGVARRAVPLLSGLVASLQPRAAVQSAASWQFKALLEQLAALAAAPQLKELVQRLGSKLAMLASWPCNSIKC